MRLVADDGGLGKFQVQARGRQAGVAQALGHHVGQVAAAQLARRHVDRDEQRLHRFAVPAPACGGRTGRAQHARSDDFDQAALFGHVDEDRGRHHAQLRMLPAQQRFGTDDAAVGHAEHRLVHQAEFAALPGAAQLLLHAHAALDGLVHRAAVEPVTVLARHLGLVHRDVAVLHQRGGAGRILGEQGDADGRAQEHLAVLHHDRTAQFRHQLLRQARGAAAHVTVLDQDDELVATEARQQRIVAAHLVDRITDAVSELLQHLVAGLVAQGVVDALEVVDVGEQQRQLAACATQHHQPVVQALAERQPVGQPGQRVGIGHAPHVAVVPGDAVAHRAERAHQLADLVLALAHHALAVVVAHLDVVGRPRQLADGPHQGALRVHHDGHADQHQRRQQQRDPAQVARAEFVEARARGVDRLFLVRAHRGHRIAHAHAADALAADHDRLGHIDDLRRPLRMHAARVDRLVGQRVGHRLAVHGDVGRAVVDDAALVVVDQHIADIGLLLRGTHDAADGIQVEVIQRVGQRIAQLVDRGLAVPAQAVLDHAVHGIPPQVGDLLLHHLLPVQQGPQQGEHHRQHDRHRRQEARLQAEAHRLHSSCSRTRATPRRRSSRACWEAGSTGRKRVVRKNTLNASLAAGS